eukprot:4271000-Alexandrium_andersonii.AAC.1
MRFLRPEWPFVSVVNVFQPCDAHMWTIPLGDFVAMLLLRIKSATVWCMVLVRCIVYLVC